MNVDFGAFALRQILASAVVLGPILVLIGLSFHLFTEDRRSVKIYIAWGVLLTGLGAFCLYNEFKQPEKKSLTIETELESRSLGSI